MLQHLVCNQTLKGAIVSCWSFSQFLNCVTYFACRIKMMFNQSIRTRLDCLPIFMLLCFIMLLIGGGSQAYFIGGRYGSYGGWDPLFNPVNKVFSCFQVYILKLHNFDNQANNVPVLSIVKVHTWMASWLASWLDGQEWSCVCVCVYSDEKIFHHWFIQTTGFVIVWWTFYENIVVYIEFLVPSPRTATHSSAAVSWQPTKCVHNIILIPDLPIWNVCLKINLM